MNKSSVASTYSWVLSSTWCRTLRSLLIHIDPFPVLHKIIFYFSMIQLDSSLMAACDPKMFTEAPESTLAKPIFLLGLNVIESNILKRLPVCHRLRFPNNICPPVLWHKKGVPFIHLYSATKNGKNLVSLLFYLGRSSKELEVLLARLFNNTVGNICSECLWTRPNRQQ